MRIDENCTRRSFHRRAAAVAAACAAPAWTGASAEAGEQQGKFPAGRFVDIHVHLGQPWNSRGPLTPEMMLRWMDAHQISQAVVLSLISPESWFYPITPQWVLEQTAAHRDRLIPFCSVDPRTINLGGRKGMVDILKRYVDAGAKGFGEHKWGGPIDDPRNLEVFQACGEVSLPILFHMDDARNTDQPGLPGLEKVLRENPNVNFIGHAQGWWASISGDVTATQLGGYPRTAIAPGGAIDRLMEKYPNIFGDLSAGSGANAIRRDTAFGREFLIRRADRLLFGTDYLANGQGVPQFELLDSIELPDEVRHKIYRDNARRLLGLEP
ncbi:MAG: amidohydrolase family protein [Planctomycetales bacterium]|nr:amidohydrolase family protein [Planctomycetales bacterium]